MAGRDGGGDIRLDRGGFFERQGARYVDRDIAKDFGSNRSQPEGLDSDHAGNGLHDRTDLLG